MRYLWGEKVCFCGLADGSINRKSAKCQIYRRSSNIKIYKSANLRICDRPPLEQRRVFRREGQKILNVLKIRISLENRKKSIQLFNCTICLEFYLYFWVVECCTMYTRRRGRIRLNSWKLKNKYLVPPSLQIHNTEIQNKYSLRKKNCPFSVLISTFMCLWAIYM